MQIHSAQLLTQHPQQHNLNDSLGTAFHSWDKDQITKENFYNYFWKHSREELDGLTFHTLLIQDK